jgi:hypothetical protein
MKEEPGEERREMEVDEYIYDDDDDVSTRSYLSLSLYWCSRMQSVE